jgi:NAD+ synthase
MIPKLDCDKVVDSITRRLRMYLANAHRESGILGLSGGIDSSVVAYLTARALGPERTFIYLLPTDATPQADIKDALRVIKGLSIPNGNWETIRFEKVLEAFEGILGKAANLERGNITARTRMIILHNKAAIHKGLVIGTGDKSEVLMGYFTKYGDAGVDILPIAGLYKTQVRQVASYLGVPERIIKKPPSPNLWPSQTAEGELGIDYETLDTILHLRFDRRMGDGEVSRASGIPSDVVERVLSRVKMTQHKRHLPETFKVGYSVISDRTSFTAWS